MAALLLVACRKPVVETARFRFAPPVGQELAVAGKAWRTVGVPGIATVDVTLDGSSRVRVKRLSAWKLEWLETIEKLRVESAGSDLLPGVSRQVAGTELRYEVMDDGDLVGVGGFDRLQQVLRQAAAELDRAEEFEAVTPWRLRERERDDWNERVHALVGKAVVLGQAIDATSRIDLGHGRLLAHQVRLTPVEWRPCVTGRCVAVKVEYLADPEAVSRVVNSPAAGLIPQLAELDPTVKIRGVEVLGGGERVIDPATMLVFAENVTRKLHLTFGWEDGRSLTLAAIDGREMTTRIVGSGSPGS